ncbi:type II toxin-antitoxin system VapC family toxin [Sphingomonas sp.]|uniref:type II toxin-antitoxin system VapC family toxin n=1 Tax=Sphingomonas sp. TaxID=28214 RepID=UPI002EDA317E
MADPQFLLDANLCIYVLQGASPMVRERLERHAPGAVVTSAIVYAEVMRKINPADHAEYAKAAAFFSIIPVMPFDAAAALIYRAVPFRRGSFDRLIAAHALALKLIVATNNVGDFTDVPGLRVENWTVA